VQTRRDSGEVEVSSHVVDGLQNVLDAIQAVSCEIAEAMRAVRPDRFCVELGFEIKGEAGGLVAMLVRAGGTATVKVSLEWQKTTAPTVVPAAATSPALFSPPV
jgi:Trypsin-co-occurring domain 1